MTEDERITWRRCNAILREGKLRFSAVDNELRDLHGCILFHFARVSAVFMAFILIMSLYGQLRLKIEIRIFLEVQLYMQSSSSH